MSMTYGNVGNCSYCCISWLSSSTPTDHLLNTEISLRISGLVHNSFSGLCYNSNVVKDIYSHLH